MTLKIKGIGLQRLSLSSEDGSRRDKHFATNFMKNPLVYKEDIEF